MQKNIGNDVPRKVSNTQLNVQCFQECFGFQAYRNKWIYSDVWVEIIKKHITHIPKDANISTRNLNKGAGCRWNQFGLDDIQVPNQVGVYRFKWHDRYMYYVTEKGKGVTTTDFPTSNKWHNKWIDSIDEAYSNEVNVNGTRPSSKRRLKGVRLANKSKKPRRSRRISTRQLTREQLLASDIHNAQSEEDDLQALEENFEDMDYWSSTEAVKVFGVITDDDPNENDDIKDVITGRIRRLREAYQVPSGWRSVISDADIKNKYSEKDVHELRLNCRYVVKALEVGLEKMGNPHNLSWEDCCKEAIESINSFEKSTIDSINLMEGQMYKRLYITSNRTVRNWHLSFRKGNECFINKYSTMKNDDLPPLLDRYPEGKKAMILFASKNLNQLSAELVHSHVHEVILVELCKARKAELGTEKLEIIDLLKENGLVKLCVPTIFRWMRRLGFKYEMRRKCYYVDSHEKPEIIKYRKTFIQNYLKLELRMHRWIQLTIEDFNILCRENPTLLAELNSPGFQFEDDSGVKSIEFHVDDHSKFQKMMEKEQFGGKMSVKAAGLRPLIYYCFMFDHSCGHDKKRQDGLNASQMRKGFGGKQPAMRPSVIENVDYLGKHPTILSVGSTQHMLYQDGDTGPCYLSDKEKEAQRKDRLSGKQKKYVFTKSELIKKLENKAVPAHGTKKDLQERCRREEIPFEEMRDEVIEGWEGKPKGMLQIMWERGFIDPNIPVETLYNAYTIANKRDQYGKEIAKTGLAELVSGLPDFVGEKTLLQYHAESRSKTEGCQIMVIRSPKCHPEIAGEGVEYDWAAAKTCYRRLKKEEKDTKKKFADCVQNCLDSINLNARRSFSRRAREYMLAYDAFRKIEKENESSNDEGIKKEPASAYLLDKVVKLRKSHRGVGHDEVWVQSVLQKMKEEPTHKYQ